MKNRLPAWFKQDVPDEIALRVSRKLSEFNIHTVCKEARCPNINNCFKHKNLTFMILGNTCTRHCRFCNLGTVLELKQKRPFQEDSLRLTQEPSLISEVVKIMDLRYVVITSVTRDDLHDGGASIFAKTIELIHALNREIKVEVLIPDFQGKVSSLTCVLEANPYVVAHNIETVRRLYKDLRPQADYQLSVNILGKIKKLAPLTFTKSFLMLGLGETKEEVVYAMEDLKNENCDILTLGQYLAPSVNHYPVKEFLDIGQFQEYEQIGISLGFKKVVSGPLVRSSYKAEEVCQELIHV
jgi:lipoic acid synthetase